MQKKALFYLEQARQLLYSIQQEPQSDEDREKLSIELAELILQAAKIMLPFSESLKASKVTKLFLQPKSRAFILGVLDLSFRSSSEEKTVQALLHLIEQTGIPSNFHRFRRFNILLFSSLATSFPKLFMKLFRYLIFKSVSHMVIVGSEKKLLNHLKKRKKENCSLSLYHPNENICCAAEAEETLQLYLQDLQNPSIAEISVKISLLIPKINPLNWEKNIEKAAESLRKLYRAAKDHFFESNGQKKQKLVHLDIETYETLYFSVDLFQKVLKEEEFSSFSAGIALPSYYPDAFSLQQKLTSFAKTRKAPIYLLLVKGSYLGAEQILASQKNWPQATFTNKSETDGNYKRMLLYGLEKEHMEKAPIIVATHHVFDLAFALVVAFEKNSIDLVSFAFFEGRASHIRNAIQFLTEKSFSLYCAYITKDRFPKAISYLMRRCNECINAENFVRIAYTLTPNSSQWTEQESSFIESLQEIKNLSSSPRRSQFSSEFLKLASLWNFEPHPETDFTSASQQIFAKNIIEKYSTLISPPIPLVIDDQELFDNEEGIGCDPSKFPKQTYRYALAKNLHIQKAFYAAKKIENDWKATSLEHRLHIFKKIIQLLQEQKTDLIGSIMRDSGKILQEADSEVSKTISLLEYYIIRSKKFDQQKDVGFEPKGIIFVSSCWGFPCLDIVQSLAAALIGGNCVLFSPALESVHTAFCIAKIFWHASVPKEVLQFLPCSSSVIENDILPNPYLSSMIFSGSAEQAKKFHQKNPQLDMSTFLSGKNAIIMTALADRQLAIENIISSSFGFSGQKYSSCSVVFLEEELFSNASFLQSLKKATENLHLGSVWDTSTQLGPLIREPMENEKKALTLLENKEGWLVKPENHPSNPLLWSPGIKLGCTEESFTVQAHFFAPVLSLVPIKNLDEGIKFCNQLPFGMAMGLQSLDKYEQDHWMKNIEASSLYLNRTITGAAIQKNPFGGSKNYPFYNDFKAGGPNHILSTMKLSQISLPTEKKPINHAVNALTNFIEKISLSSEQLALWYVSISNYAYWWTRLKYDWDPNKLIGQDNFLRYIPRTNVLLRIYPQDSVFDLLRTIAAALSCLCPLQISFDSTICTKFSWKDLSCCLTVIDETEEIFLERIQKHAFRIRLISPSSKELQKIRTHSPSCAFSTPVLANGRYELLHYLREITISHNYHRYGNFGAREEEFRKMPT